MQESINYNQFSWTNRLERAPEGSPEILDQAAWKENQAEIKELQLTVLLHPKY